MDIDKDFYTQLKTVPIYERINNQYTKRFLTALEIGEIKHFISIEDSTPEDIIDLLDTLLKGYGVESISAQIVYIDDFGCIADGYKPALLYVNMGDTYDLTALYDTREDLLRCGSWGNWVETNEETTIDGPAVVESIQTVKRG